MIMEFGCSTDHHFSPTSEKPFSQAIPGPEGLVGYRLNRAGETKLKIPDETAANRFGSNRREARCVLRY
jgi:hypothetical protein